jgi:hypothetical protein
MGYHFGHVNTKSNVISDGSSCIPSKLALSHDFLLFLAKDPSLCGCQCFLPNAALISSIVAALWQTECMNLLSASKLLLTNPGRFTSSLGAFVGNVSNILATFRPDTPRSHNLGDIWNVTDNVT